MDMLKTYPPHPNFSNALHKLQNTGQLRLSLISK